MKIIIVTNLRANDVSEVFLPSKLCTVSEKEIVKDTAKFEQNFLVFKSEKLTRFWWKFIRKRKWFSFAFSSTLRRKVTSLFVWYFSAGKMYIWQLNEVTRHAIVLDLAFLVRSPSSSLLFFNLSNKKLFARSELASHETIEWGCVFTQN